MLDLESVFTTLSYSLIVASIAVFVVLCFLIFQKVRGSGAIVKKEKYLAKIRFAVVLFPLLWMVLNFDSDSNYLAEYMFSTYVPFVLVCIIAIGLFEIVMPFLRAAGNETANSGKRFLDLGRKK